MCLSSTKECSGRFRGTSFHQRVGARARIFVTSSTAALFLALVAGGFLRFYRLGRLTLNHDEPFTTYIINQGSWLQIATSTVPTERGTPPLYFLLLKLWCVVFGDQEWALRFPSAALGTAAILLIFLLGSELYSAEVGAVAAMLLALNPMHMDYSRDARFYPLFVCLALINGWLFVRLMRRDSKTEATLYAITLALLIYAHLYAAFFVAAEICYAAGEWFKGRNIRGFILGTMLGLGLLAPYFSVLASDFVGRLNEQLTYTTGLRYAAPVLFYREASGSLMVPVILPLAGYTLSEAGDTTLLLSYWAVIPVFGVYLASFLYPYRLVFTARYLLPVLPIMMLLAARGLWRLKAVSKLAFLAVILYTAAIGGFSFRRIIRYKARDWRTIASTIQQRAGADRVGVNTGSLNVLRYYLDSRGAEVIGVHCSGEPLRDVPALTSLWYVYSVENSCDAMALKGLSSRYKERGRTQLGKDVTLVHLIAAAERAPASTVR